MEPNSHPIDHTLSVYEDQIRECFGRVAYSHKTHEKQADAVLDRLGRWKMWQLIISVLVTGSLVASILGSNVYVTVLTAILSAILTFLNTYFKNYDLGRIAEKHKEAANKLWSIRESYQSLITDIVAATVNPADAIKRRDELQKALSIIYSSAPRTNYASYQKAQTALKQNEDLTFSDAEIDAFLPTSLKKSSRRDKLNSQNTP